MNKGAVISADKKYRYSLWRIWDSNLKMVGFVGLNPSTADESIDDPTIIRCIEFSKSWGYGGFYMVNLFAYRSTDPKILINVSNPIGDENDMYISEISSKVDLMVCAWGNDGKILNRNIEVLQLINNPYCLKINSSGEPSHPLYLKKDLKPKKYIMNKTDENIEFEKQYSDLKDKLEYFMNGREYPQLLITYGSSRSKEVSLIKLTESIDPNVVDVRETISTEKQLFNILSENNGKNILFRWSWAPTVLDKKPLISLIRSAIGWTLDGLKWSPVDYKGKSLNFTGNIILDTNKDTLDSKLILDSEILRDAITFKMTANKIED